MTIQATLDARQVVTRAKAPAASARDPILASRITVPGVPDWSVPRPRITKLITEGVRWCPLTVVTGPPGAGKTMALALWTAAEPGPVAWVSLDECNNRPDAFWSYVVAALRRSGVTVPKGLPGAARAQAGDLGFLLRLAAALAAQDPPVTLVLDDLHLVTDPTVLDGLDFMLRNVGPGLRLVACSRIDPPMRLHRYRGAGQLAEIHSSDLAFTTAEAGLLLARHGIRLTADVLECLTRRTEGWAVGLRLAALSLRSHPDPPRFVKELIAEDAFIQPVGSGWYRYHELFAEVLRLTLRRESPDRVALLHRRAARWHERAGLLTEAVRHAARGGDWQLAADLVIDDLAIDQVLQPQCGQSLAAAFAGMPSGHAWPAPQPYLVSAAVALSAGQPESCAAALAAADGVLERVPADQQAACGLAAALIRLAASLPDGDVAAASAAAARAEALLSQVPDQKLDRHPEIRARVLSGRGAVELWSGHLDEAARLLQARMAAQSGSKQHPADCLGHLALTEALRGRLRRAARLAAQATASTAGSPGPSGQNPDPAAFVALAWLHLERNDLREAGSWLKQADAALGASPANLIAAVAYLVAARGALAEGRAAVVKQIVTRARSGCCIPGWLDHELSLVQSRACALAGDLPAAIATAERAGADTSPEVAVTLAHAWMTAGDGVKARRALAPALAADSGAPDRVLVQAWLVDARLSYASSDPARGRRSLASALRLAEPEQLRLPFAMDRNWIGPVLRHDPDLASTHRQLLAPTLPRVRLPAPPGAPEQAAILAVEPLSDREREVLRQLSGMLSTAEVASEMHISLHTVKTHVRSILRKLAVPHRREAVRRARQLGLI